MGLTRCTCNALTNPPDDAHDDYWHAHTLDCAVVWAAVHRDPSLADPTDHYEENPA